MTASYREQLKEGMQAFVPSSFFAPARPPPGALDAPAFDVDGHVHGLGRRTKSRSPLGASLPTRRRTASSLEVGALVLRLCRSVGARISDRDLRPQAAFPADDARARGKVLDDSRLANLCGRRHADRSSAYGRQRDWPGLRGKNAVACWAGTALGFSRRAGHDERTHARDLVDGLPARAAGGRCRLRQLRFLPQVAPRQARLSAAGGGNLALLTELGYYAEEKDGWVYLWPKTHRHGEPLVLRLIVLKTQNAAIGKCSRRKAKPLGEP